MNKTRMMWAGGGSALLLAAAAGAGLGAAGVANTVRGEASLPLIERATDTKATPDGAYRVDAAVTADAVGDGSEVEAKWQAELLAGAVATRLRAQGNTEPMAGGRIDVRLPSGALVLGDPGSLAVSPAIPDVAFVSDPESDGVAQRVRSVAARYGYRVVRLDYAEGLTPAPVVVLQATRPSLDDTHLQEIITATVGVPNRYEGSFFEVRDHDGNPVVRVADARRAGVGMLWIRPGFDGDPGVPHGTLVGGSKIRRAVSLTGVVRSANRRVLRVCVQGRASRAVVAVSAKGAGRHVKAIRMNKGRGCAGFVLPKGTANRVLIQAQPRGGVANQWRVVPRQLRTKRR